MFSPSAPSRPTKPGRESYGSVASSYSKQLRKPSATAELDASTATTQQQHLAESGNSHSSRSTPLSSSGLSVFFAGSPAGRAIPVPVISTPTSVGLGLHVSDLLHTPHSRSLDESASARPLPDQSAFDISFTRNSHGSSDKGALCPPTPVRAQPRGTPGAGGGLRRLDSLQETKTLLELGVDGVDGLLSPAAADDVGAPALPHSQIPRVISSSDPTCEEEGKGGSDGGGRLPASVDAPGGSAPWLHCQSMNSPSESPSASGVDRTLDLGSPDGLHLSSVFLPGSVAAAAAGAQHTRVGDDNSGPFRVGADSGSCGPFTGLVSSPLDRTLPAGAAAGGASGGDAHMADASLSFDDGASWEGDSSLLSALGGAAGEAGGGDPLSTSLHGAPGAEATLSHSRSGPPPQPFSRSRASAILLDSSSSSHTAAAPAANTSKAPPRSSVTLDGSFVVLHELGRGSFSKVLEVVSKADGAHFAVKQSLKAMRSRRERAERLREVLMSRKIGVHEHVVDYLTAWQEDGKVHVQMELCAGGSFTSAVEAELLRLVNGSPAGFGGGGESSAAADSTSAMVNDYVTTPRPTDLLHGHHPFSFGFGASSATGAAGTAQSPTLAAKLAVPEPTIWSFIAQVASGLQHLHSVRTVGARDPFDRTPPLPPSSSAPRLCSARRRPPRHQARERTCDAAGHAQDRRPRDGC
jgi:hypothetical protein